MRESGDTDDIPRALLSRAEYYLAAGLFAKAKEDLEEVLEIAENGGMKLYLVDYNIEMFHLLTAQMQTQEAQNYKNKAEILLEETGYKRAVNKLLQ